MAKSDTAVLHDLKWLTHGLMFQSESDYPLEPFMRAAKGDKPPSPQDIMSVPKGGAANPVDFDSFFGTATQEQDGQDAEALGRIKKFQALVKYLKDHLSELQVYKVGDEEADVYVIGKTASGSLAGLKTKVVET
ncbi:MAG: hypothetical protein QOE46_2390 [Acidobacteriota bacterium]|jgi:hypothetical protein|nr:hypothetical protein [Acidobacteriota bacterium]